MIVSNYKRLFSIEFRHDAYQDRNAILRDINIDTDETTSQIMNGKRLSYKFDRNILFCFVETIASIDTKGGSVKITTENKPLIDFDENAQLTFKMTINCGKFLNNSDLRLLDSNNKLFIFSNTTGNKQVNQFYLTKVSPFVNQNDLVRDDEKENCFAVIKISFQKSLPDDFSLLEGDNTIKGKNYIIHFKSN